MTNKTITPEMFKYGTNEHQDFYDLKVGKDYLVVYRNKKGKVWFPDCLGAKRIWLLTDKKRQAKAKPGTHCIFASKDPQGAIKAICKAYNEGVKEI